MSRGKEIENGDSIDRLVSLTFDEDPEVRKKAAEALKKIDDPRATFALIELSSDKDDSVKETAGESLEKVEGEEAYSLLEELFTPQAKEKQKEQKRAPIARIVSNMDSDRAIRMRDKLMPSLERLFGDDEKAKELKKKLMPSLEKVFEKSIGESEKREKDKEKDKYKEKDEIDPLAEIEQIQTLPEYREKVREHDEKEKEEKKEKQEKPEKPEEIEEGRKAVEQAMKDEFGLEKLDEIEILEAAEVEEDEDEEKIASGFDRTYNFYEYAYNIATTPGVKKSQINSEEKKLLTQLKKEVKLAFKLAKARAEGGIVSKLSELGEGMKKLYTGELDVAFVEETEYRRGRRTERLTRILLEDVSGTYPLYLFGERGKGIEMGDKVKLENAYVKKFPGTEEVAISVTPKGKVYVIK